MLVYIHNFIGSSTIWCQERCAEAEGESAQENGRHISGKFYTIGFCNGATDDLLVGFLEFVTTKGIFSEVRKSHGNWLSSLVYFREPNPHSMDKYLSALISNNLCD